MAFPYEVPDPQGLQEAANVLRKEFAWVGAVLNTYLPPVKPNALVCCAPIGNAIELLHVRDFVGPKAKIFGVDIEKEVEYGGIPNINQIAIVASGAYFIRGDIRNLNQIMRQMARTPDVVISRHPQIIEEIEEETGRIFKQNDWWLDPLVALANRVKEKGGTFLATCYLMPERDLLAEALTKRGLRPEIFENDFSPREYWAQAGPLTKKPDGFVLRV